MISNFYNIFNLYLNGYDISFINLNYTLYGMINHSDKLIITYKHWCLFGHQGLKVQINN